MSRADFEIDLSNVFEAGAIILALLALPKGDETEPQDLVASLCHLALKARLGVDETTAKEVPIKPAYAFRNEADVVRDLKLIERLLRDEILAARLAVPLLQKAKSGRVPKLPKDVERLSLNELSKIALSDLVEKGDVSEEAEPKEILKLGSGGRVFPVILGRGTILDAAVPWLLNRGAA